MPKEQNIKQAQNIIDEISSRRHWLLWHNKSFRTDLESLVQTTGIKLRDMHPVWRSFYNVPDLGIIGKDHPSWRQFYENWGIGSFWSDGGKIYRVGERPLGLEVLLHNGQAQYARLIFWPGEVNKKRISESWDYIEHLLETHFAKKNDPPWSLKVNNFWRDARWYNLKWLDTHWNDSPEKITDLMERDTLYRQHRLNIYDSFKEAKQDHEKSLVRTILKQTKQEDPLIFDRLYVEQLINQEKTGAKEPLLDTIDPDRKIAKDKKYNTLNLLLYHLGILAIANTKADLGEDFPYEQFSMEVIPEENNKLRSAGKFFVRYDLLQLEEKRFVVTDEQKAELHNKKKIRNEFEADQQAFLLDEQGWTDAAFIIKEGIRQMQKRIDAMG